MKLWWTLLIFISKYLTKAQEWDTDGKYNSIENIKSFLMFTDNSWK